MFELKGIPSGVSLEGRREDFLVAHPDPNIRDTVHLNVNLLKCQTPKLGYSFYECPNCGFEHR